MSPYNEWISQYHKILKVLFLNHYSSWKCMWLLWLACIDSPHISGETQVLWFGGWRHWTGMWEMHLLFPAQMPACFITACSPLCIYLARHRAVQRLRSPDASAHLCFVELGWDFAWYLGWSFLGSSYHPTHPLCQWLWEPVMGFTLNSLPCFALWVQ